MPRKSCCALALLLPVLLGGCTATLGSLGPAPAPKIALAVSVAPAPAGSGADAVLTIGPVPAVVHTGRPAAAGEAAPAEPRIVRVEEAHLVRHVVPVPDGGDVPAYDETGQAAWYGPGFAGRPTASGEIFDPDLLTAAHPTLPLPSLVRITNLDNGRSALVRVNDRGPFDGERLIDVSHGTAVELGFLQAGTARVRVQTVPAGPVTSVAMIPD